ncbi:MAG: hypothetical protein V4487_03070 [Chlamydiota bacterium]
MRFILSILFLFHSFALAIAADFDYVVVGSSPFSLFEALYHAHLGDRVMIVEDDSECGGAWKGINVCGIQHADLGCHQIGHDMQLKTFLEEYAGCTMVSLDNPQIPYTSQNSGSNGYYFSKGCYELIDHLLQLIERTNIVLLLNHKLEKVSFDLAQKIAHLKIKDKQVTTKKLILTPMSCFSVENQPPENSHKSKYYHLYLLIQDPTPPQFSYHGRGGISGVSRIMNLTHYVGLSSSGRHLLVIQTHDEKGLANGQMHLDAMKKNNLIDPSSYILKSESYIYEAGHFNQGCINQAGASEFVEVLNTSHILGLASYISKWKQSLKPFAVALGKK